MMLRHYDFLRMIKLFPKNEITVFNDVDGIIDHNRKMHAWLNEQGVTTPCIDLEIFDYYNPTELRKRI